MAEGYEPKPLESDINGIISRIGNGFSHKTFTAGGTDKSYILNDPDNRYPTFLIYGMNGEAIIQVVQVKNSAVSTVYNGASGASNLNPVWMSMNSCKITIKGYAILGIISRNPFTMTEA